MKITYFLIGVLFFACVTFLAGCGGVNTAEQKHRQELSFAEVERHDVLYTCPGLQCKSNTVSTKSGKCDCGRILKWGHVLKIEGTEAILCQCGEGCRCYALDQKDPSKCTCGLHTKRVSLVGTGIYFCNCGGGGGFCNYVSDSPGKCRCGNTLIKVD